LIILETPYGYKVSCQKWPEFVPPVFFASLRGNDESHAKILLATAVEVAATTKIET